MSTCCFQYLYTIVITIILRVSGVLRSVCYYHYISIFVEIGALWNFTHFGGHLKNGHQNGCHFYIAFVTITFLMWEKPYISIFVEIGALWNFTHFGGHLKNGHQNGCHFYIAFVIVYISLLDLLHITIILRVSGVLLSLYYHHYIESIWCFILLVLSPLYWGDCLFCVQWVEVWTQNKQSPQLTEHKTNNHLNSLNTKQTITWTHWTQNKQSRGDCLFCVQWVEVIVCFVLSELRWLFVLCSVS
jgi:hypothetical protein